jgi:hypothetical protein
MRRHPNVILRICGEAVEGIAPLKRAEAATLFARQQCRSAEAKVMAAAVCKQLEESYKKLDGKPAQRALLSAKRDIYNLRTPDISVIDQFAHALKDDVARHLQRILDSIRCVRECEGEIQRVYDTELAASRIALRELLAQDNLRNAIRYTNPQLFLRLARAYQPGAAAGYKPNDLHKLDDTFLQYALRAATKTSPLSSFTPTWLGRWHEDGDDALAVKLDEWRLEQRVELKRALLNLLADAARRFGPVVDELRLAFSPSARIQGEEIAWQRVARGNTTIGKFLNTSSMECRARFTAPLRAIKTRLQENPGGLSCRDVVAILGGGVPAPKARAYISQLFLEGLLVDAEEVPEQSRFEGTIERLFVVADRTVGIDTLTLWRHVEQLLQSYAGSRADEKAGCLKAIEDGVRELASRLDAKVEPQFFSPVLYEDFCQSGEARVDPDSLAAIEPDLERLLSLSPVLDFNATVQSALATDFVRRFGEMGTCQDIEPYLKDFHDRLLAQPSAAKMATATQGDAASEAIGVLREKFLQLFVPRLNSGEDLDIPLDAADELISQIPQVIRRRAVSHCFLGQFFLTHDSQRRFVLNQMFPGASFLFSRFLLSASDACLQEVREYVSRICEVGSPIGVPGVFGFNASLHPRLAPTELRIDPFPAGHPDARGLQLRDLHLFYDRKTHRVYLRDKSGQAYEAFYFGFLNSAALPTLHKVFAAMNSQGMIIHVRGELIRHRLISETEPTRVGRVSLGSIVLGRRTVYFPRATMPRHDGSDFEYFCEVQQWRRTHQLPDEAFVKFVPLSKFMASVSRTSNPSEPIAADLTEMKPLYMDFRSPIFVRLLGRLQSRNDFDLCVQELLPALGTGTAAIGGRQHVTEWQIELSRNGE